MDALLYDTAAGVNRYAAVKDGDDAGYADSSSAYDQQGTYDAHVATGYGFLDLSVPYQGMYEPSYRLSAL